jgi:hypothetical protein
MPQHVSKQQLGVSKQNERPPARNQGGTRLVFKRATTVTLVPANFKYFRKWPETRENADLSEILGQLHKTLLRGQSSSAE